MALRLQRSGLPLMILAALGFAAAAVVVAIRFDPFGWLGSRGPVTGSAAVPESTAPQPAAPATSAPAATQSPAASTPATTAPAAATPAAQSTPAPESQAPAASIPAAGTHVIRRGDTLFDLSGTFWNDPYRWPLLYEANRGILANPDLLRPGTRLAVPAATEKADRIAEAHVAAYEAYRAIGLAGMRRGSETASYWAIQVGRLRLNKAYWVLYSGLRYDASLLDRFASRIDPADRALVAGFVSRFGGPRR